MKYSKAEAHCKTHGVSALRFEDNYDPLVMRTLGLRRLPDVATLSRGLARADAESAKRLQGLVRERVVMNPATIRSMVCQTPSSPRALLRRSH